MARLECVGDLMTLLPVDDARADRGFDRTVAVTIALIGDGVRSDRWGF